VNLPFSLFSYELTIMTKRSQVQGQRHGYDNFLRDTVHPVYTNIYLFNYYTFEGKGHVLYVAI